MRKIFMLAVVLASILAITSSGAMAQKLTGGAEWVGVGTVKFSVTANAITTGKGEIKGNIQYSREDQSIPDLYVHAAVQCLGISGDGGLNSIAVAAGPAVAQLDPSGAVSGWLVVFVKEGGTGYGDRVRVIFAPKGDSENPALGTARYYCANPTVNTSFPGLVEEGNFTIRP